MLPQSDVHDGVDFVRTACVIAVSKSKDILDPLIHQVSVGGSSGPCWTVLASRGMLFEALRR